MAGELRIHGTLVTEDEAEGDSADAADRSAWTSVAKCMLDLAIKGHM